MVIKISSLEQRGDVKSKFQTKKVITKEIVLPPYNEIMDSPWMKLAKDTPSNSSERS